MDYEVQAAVSALGYLDGDKYLKEADCFETVKDLIRYLRRDGDNKSIRRHLGESNVVENDLVPILICYSDDVPLFDATLRLLINLTQPAVQCFDGKIPPDFATRQIFLQIHEHSRKSKRCFTKETLYQVLFAKLNDLLKLDWENRQEEDRISIERILSVIKNILTLPPAEEDMRRTDTDITLHDQILWALHKSGFEDIIFLFIERNEERRFHLLILEIIGLMLKDHKAEDLAKAGLERSYAEKRKDEQALLVLHEKAKANKNANLKRCSGRHTNFAGSYLVHGLNSILDNKDIVAHKVLTKFDNVTLDSRKRRHKPPKNRAPLLFENEERKSALTIRLFLKEFCERFLNHYSRFVDSIRQLLGRVDRRQHMIECYYIWSIRFFTEFARNMNFNEDFRKVLSTISVNMFHYLLMQMNDYFEMMKTEKFEAVTWGKRFHNALQTYKELFSVLLLMDKTTVEDFIDVSMDIKKHVFYVDEYSEYFVDYIKNFSPASMSKACLKDLIECVHVYMKLFEVHCQVHGGSIIMQKKKRKRKARKQKNKQNFVPVDETEEEKIERILEEKELLWDSISGELSDVLQGYIDLPTDVVPFDAVAEHEFDEKTVAKVRIQESLNKRQPAAAVALLRVSRQLWPEEKSSFGELDIEAEDEFLFLRQIFFIDLPKIIGENVHVDDNINDVDENMEENVDEDDALNEELEETENGFMLKEVEFSFLSYIQRFARHDTVTWYIWLLEDFESNSSFVNHCILKLFHRIAYELKSAGVLFQARLFRIFQKLSSLPAYRKVSNFDEISEFAKHFLRQFFDMAVKNKKLFLEILFWKNAKEVYELEYGYGSYDVENKNKKKSKTKKHKHENEEFREENPEEFLEHLGVNNDEDEQLLETFNNSDNEDKIVDDNDEIVDDEKIAETFDDDKDDVFDSENADVSNCNTHSLAKSPVEEETDAVDLFLDQPNDDLVENIDVVEEGVLHIC